jgi:hypothetical protein
VRFAAGGEEALASSACLLGGENNLWSTTQIPVQGWTLWHSTFFFWSPVAISITIDLLSSAPASSVSCCFILLPASRAQT